MKGAGRFKDANTIAVEGGEDVSFKSAIVATGSYPLRPPIEGIDSARCVDSTGLLAQTEVPKRLVILGGGIIGCEFASIFQRFGSEVTIVEMLPTLIPQEDDDAAKELCKQFKKRGIAVHLESQCDRSRRPAAAHGPLRRGQTVECDLMLVATGRGPVVEDLGLEAIGVEFDPKKGIAADEHRRTTVPHIYAVGDCAGYWQLAHTAFREGEVAAENATGHDAVVDNRGVPRPIYTDPEIAGVGLTEREAREQHGDDVLVGKFPCVANGRAMMQNETVGWVKSIHESRYGELLGLVMVGPHVTDLIEAGVVALDAEATVETVADGMAAHPTLSEAIKEAGLVALGRAIHIPNRSERPPRPDAKGGHHAQQTEGTDRLRGLHARQAAGEAKARAAAGRGDQAQEARRQDRGRHRSGRRRDRRDHVLAQATVRRHGVAGELERVDTVVVGAGIAGCAAARFLAAGTSVLVVDRAASEPVPRGETAAFSSASPPPGSTSSWPRRSTRTSSLENEGSVPLDLRSWPMLCWPSRRPSSPTRAHMRRRSAVRRSTWARTRGSRTTSPAASSSGGGFTLDAMSATGRR